MADVSLKVGAFIGELERNLNKAKGKLAQFTGFVQRNQAKIKKARLGAAAALAGGILIMRDLTKAYGVQEQAEVGLAQAMKNAGTYTKEAFEQTKVYASELQRLSNYGDEEIITAQAMLVTLGQLSGEGLERATQATLDLATSLKMDLNAAASLLAKTIGSSTNALTRYGIEIDNTLEGSERTAALLDVIERKMSGQALAASETYTGQLKQLSMAFGDIKEDLGEAILPLLVGLAKKIQEVLPPLSDFIKKNQKLIMVLAGGGIGGAGLIILLSQFALAFTNPVTGVIAVIGLAAIAIAAIVIKLKGLKEEAVKTPLHLLSREELEEDYQIAMKRMDMLKNNMKDLYADVVAGDEEDPLVIASKKFIQRRVEDIEVQAEVIKRLRAAILATITVPETPQDIEQPDISIPGIPTEEDIENMETVFERIQELQGENYTILEEMGAEHSAYAREIEAERNASIMAQAEETAFALNSIWSIGFNELISNQKKFSTALALSMLQGLIGTLQMAVDMYLNKLTAKILITQGEIMLSSILNPVNLAKLALVGAVRGTIAGGLNKVVGRARASMMKSVPSYEYGGDVPQTGLAWVHAGEQIFNPAHAMDSMKNMGGVGFTYNHYGNLNTKRDIYESLLDFEERMFSRRLARGMG